MSTDVHPGDNQPPSSKSTEYAKWGSPRYFIPEWCLPLRKGPEYFYDETLFDTDFVALSSADLLPEEILVDIFRRLHPTDRILSASCVCKRWNRLVYAKGIWTQLLVDSTNFDFDSGDSAEALLQFLAKPNVCACLTRLEVDDNSGWKPSFKATTVLPDSLPCLQHFKDYTNTDHTDILCYRRTMPELETLIVRFDHGYYVEEETDRVFNSLSRASFSLRSLCIEQSVDVRFVRWLLQDQPYLYQVCLISVGSRDTDPGCDTDERSHDNTHICPEITNVFGDEVRPKQHVLHSFLSRLSISYGEPREIENAVWMAPRVTVLDLRNATNLTTGTIMDIRKLRFLKHLHLCRAPRIGEERLRFLFQKAEGASEFPSGLQYLSINEPEYFYESVATEIPISCPLLQSLCVFTEWQARETFVKLVIKRLSQLRYLRLGSVHYTVTKILSQLREDELPHLRYIEWKDVTLLKEEFEQLELLQSKRPQLHVVTSDGNTIRFNGKVSGDEAIDRYRLWRAVSNNDERDGLCCVNVEEFC